MSKREELKNIFQKKTSIESEAVWVLGEIKKKSLFLEWGFTSFGQWVKEDCKGYISPSYAYALASAGEQFWDDRESIAPRIDSGYLKVRDIVDIAARVKRGLDKTEAIDYIVRGVSIACENLTRTEPGGDENVILKTYLPRGDKDRFLAGITKYCLANGLKTVSDAIRDIGLYYFDSKNIPNIDLPEKYLKYLPIIESGNFFCAVCNDIPLEPTFHHILPVGQGGLGYGPQALVCWSPCHEEEIHGRISGKPKWKIHCRRMGFNWKVLKSEAESQLKEHGKIDQIPTKLIYGTYRNIRG